MNDTPATRLPADYQYGTQRLISPERTLARITPILPKVGITRCLDITGLDCIGIPVFSAARPHSTILQLSSGKGVTATHARCSALMESIELHHAENLQPERIAAWSSERTLRDAHGSDALLPHADCPGFSGTLFHDALRQPWVEAIDLLHDRPLLIPAAAAYFCEPGFCRTTTNGLASGNHPVEASLHALYELIERDAVSQLSNAQGVLKIRDRVGVVRLDTVQHAPLAELIEKIHVAGSDLVLMAVPARVAVHVFWAVLIDQTTQTAVAALNVGFGAHTDPTIAACRAVTEAAQSRLIFIHGGREDISDKIASQAGIGSNTRVFRYFRALPEDTDWAAVAARIDAPPADRDLFGIHRWLLDALAASGCTTIVQHTLTRPDLDIPVVKVITPQLRFNQKLF